MCFLKKRTTREAQSLIGESVFRFSTKCRDSYKSIFISQVRGKVKLPSLEPVHHVLIDEKLKHADDDTIQAGSMCSCCHRSTLGISTIDIFENAISTELTGSVLTFMPSERHANFDGPGENLQKLQFLRRFLTLTDHMLTGFCPASQGCSSISPRGSTVGRREASQSTPA